ncbi:hypothetical protein L249_8518 [Ophiocordyceps polyrhachis-furcata BCC 54312]|uniref:DUF1772 domain-containing protein n=1 Tax=Ophiocordyceps polyrhachis-furcata BCC 54312 TaxID=1330021 RepID=A0A367L709_9HYPO|nr:hypothetical protein L249_8518 [Ophiocordyceps polyrhachis-furcata BCC 54312]
MPLDPNVLLRTVPLISSTCSLLFAWDQHFFLSLLNKPETRPHSRPLLTSYFAPCFRRGLPFVLAAVSVSFGSGMANFFLARSSPSLPFYVVGSALAFSHLLYAPFIGPSCRKLLFADTSDPNADLDSWLSVNALRSLTVDLGAWVAFIVATVGSLRLEEAK